MAEAILFGIAEEILKNLGSAAFNKIASAWGFKARLEKLKNTIDTLKHVLLDAENRQAVDKDIRFWLEKLTPVIYAADDLFDKLATVATQKQLLGGNFLNRELRTFFSSSNQIALSFSISQKIETITQELDAIVEDSKRFDFIRRSPDQEGRVMMNARDQTHSFVDAEEVIGRDAEKKAILDMLLASTSTEHEVPSVIPIVGIGGLGKTTLAQLIYNDPQVKLHFDLRLWVCVSDVFDIKELTKKIIICATSTKTQNLDMEQLQGQLRKEVGDKKFLLVLDDVWNEKREEWLKLKTLLKSGRIGSKVLVTTRSKEVAKIMGTLPLYELPGLSYDKSLKLFEKTAFEPGQAQQKLRLMDIGTEIVKKCANVPLAIRVVGSLLYGEEEKKWLSFKDKGLAHISDDIMDILKLSYQHLRSPLKNCFAYCALFPKDYVFDKETLVDLWMAEGFIMPINQEGQNLEELAEDYFLNLLQRCFFHDIRRDELGDIRSCKMHDLMHDLAQQVAGVNCKVAKVGESNSNKGIHHLSFAYDLTPTWKIPTWMRNLKLLRTFLLPEQVIYGSSFSKSICQELISSFVCLRVLDLHSLGVESLPSSIGKLIHLRYLNLSCTPVIELPDSITKLLNLQTLNLFRCTNLRTLPTSIGKLKNLRSLDVGKCKALINFPSGLGELRSLIRLPRFTVNYENSSSSRCKPSFARLSDLKNLDNLRGVLKIETIGNINNPLPEARDANLSGKHGLTKLRIRLDRCVYQDVGVMEHDEAVMEGLKPYHNLRQLKIDCYGSQKLPSWAMKDNLCKNLPNLVVIKLTNCGRCQQVPCFSQLPNLKRLSLSNLESVRYMEMESDQYDDASTFFFPSLEELALTGMDNLKGWWKKVEETAKQRSTNEASGHQQHTLSMLLFPKLSILSVVGCRSLKYLPQCPKLEDLTIVNSNESISVSKMATGGSNSKLKSLEISDVEDLISLPRECLHQLSSLKIGFDWNMVNTEILGDVFRFRSAYSSLRFLSFYCCHSLTSLSQGLEHLTALDELVLWDCEKLDPLLSQDEHLPWKHFQRLHTLKLGKIPKLVSLPSGLQHLSNLTSLEITYNKNMREIPEWISCLSSLEFLLLLECPKLTYLPEAFPKLTCLEELQIENCPGLTARCQRPNGIDWPKIQHIPLVTVLNNFSVL